MIGRAQFAGLIPHSGSMCLIDEVRHWSAREIVCHTRSHLDPAHPLWDDGRLDAIHLVEYGAQAMAIHGALEARSRGLRIAPGLLAAVRDLRLEVERIDNLGSLLEIRARQMLAGAAGLVYEFSAWCGEQRLAAGRITVMLTQTAQ